MSGWPPNIPNPQAVSAVPSGQPPNKPTLYPTANVHGALRMPGIQLMLSLLRPVIDNLHCTQQLQWCTVVNRRTLQYPIRA